MRSGVFLNPSPLYFLFASSTFESWFQNVMAGLMKKDELGDKRIIMIMLYCNRLLCRECWRNAVLFVSLKMLGIMNCQTLWYYDRRSYKSLPIRLTLAWERTWEVLLLCCVIFHDTIFTHCKIQNSRYGRTIVYALCVRDWYCATSFYPKQST